MKAEAATISDIILSDKYDYVRTLLFSERKYKIVVASNTLYNIGEKVLFIPEGTKLPEWALKKLNMWDYAKGEGLLFGKDKNIVRPYMFNDDMKYFSYGVVIKAENGTIDTGEKQIQLNEKNIDKLLGLSYIRKGIPYYFNGDWFYCDVNIPKRSICDLEECFETFENKNVLLQKFVPGRHFYLTIERNKADHRAFGCCHNVFITCDDFTKYSFLSRTKNNISGNLFTKLAYKTSLIERAESILRNNSLINKITFDLILKTIAFGNTNYIENPSKSMVCLYDIYIGEFPYGRYLTEKEKKEIGHDYGVETQETIEESEFDYTSIEKKVDENNNVSYGITIRTEDNVNVAEMRTKKYRIRRAYTEH